MGHRRAGRRLRAERAPQEHFFPSVRAQQARARGLFLSRGIKDAEPELFSEPGLFLVQPPEPDAPNATLYYAAVNSMPFGRPAFGDLLGALDFVLENDYPARGEVPERTAAL